MRLTDLLHSDKVISKHQYEKLRQQVLKTVMCDSDGWDFGRHVDTTETEARQWVRNHRLKQAYEKKNGIEPLITVFLIHVVDHKDDQQPDWPDELKPYKTDNILEAYFCNKFDLPCE